MDDECPESELKVSEGGKTLGWTEGDPTQARRKGIQSMPGRWGDELGSVRGEEPTQITAGRSGRESPTRSNRQTNNTTAL